MRKKRAPISSPDTSASSPSSSGEYIFLPGLRQGGYTRRVRSHVVREHFRKKDFLQHGKKIPGAKEKKQPRQEEEVEGNDSRINENQQVMDLAAMSAAVSSHFLASLSAARKDPFASFAKRTTSRENFLLDFYVGDLVGNFVAMKRSSFNPCRELCFGVCITSKASISAMCAFAARHLAVRNGAGEIEALHYRAICLREIARMLENPQVCRSDAMIMAIVGTLAFFQDVTIRDVPSTYWDETSIQIQGLRSILDFRGGINSFPPHSPVLWILQWFDLLNFGEISVWRTPLSVHAYFPPSRLSVKAGESLATSGFAYSQRVLVEEFVGAIGSFHRAARERRTYHFVQGTSAIAEYFTGASTMGTILSVHPNYFVQDRVAIVLVLLNLVLWEHRDSATDFLDGIVKRLRSYEVPTITALIWCLMPDFRTHETGDERYVWEASRLLRIFARLPEQSQTMVKTLLRKFLVADDREGDDLEFDPEEFRSTIFEVCESGQDTKSDTAHMISTRYPP